MKIKELILSKFKKWFSFRDDSGRLQVKKLICTVVLILCAATFLVSTGFLADYYIKSYKQKKMNEHLSNMLQQDNAGTDSIDDYTNAALDEDFTLPPTSKFTKVVNPKTNKTLLIQTSYVDVFNLNPDLIGWIYIDGTRINYPVVQSPEWVNYYLKRDFYGQTSKYGAIFADEMADIRRPSDNVTIYGHRMGDGSMFADLHEYKSKDFYKEHSIIDFNTIFENHTYQIFSVFVTTGDASGFSYHQFVDGTKEEFDAYVAKCKSLSLYGTGVEVNYGDKLITLSTCEHNIADGRLVVVAKQIT